MPELSNININGTDYGFADIEARKMLTKIIVPEGEVAATGLNDLKEGIYVLRGKFYWYSDSAYQCDQYSTDFINAVFAFVTTSIDEENEDIRYTHIWYFDIKADTAASSHQSVTFMSNDEEGYYDRESGKRIPLNLGIRQAELDELFWQRLSDDEGRQDFYPSIGVMADYVAGKLTESENTVKEELQNDITTVSGSVETLQSDMEELREEMDNVSVSPRANFKQIRWYDKDKEKYISFEDIYAYCSGDVNIGGNVVYGLEAHETTSTEQCVYRSVDGGETWELFATLQIDATNSVWYTDIFVDSKLKVMLLLKTTDGFTGSNNQLSTFVWNGQSWYNSSNLELGKRRWLSNNNSIDVCTNADWSKRIIIFGEYHTTTDGTTYSLWKSTNNGTTWKKVLELGGDVNGTSGTGEIRHWHTVQSDPYTKHWWATSGDGNRQCRIYRSTDDGETWELLFSGSQRERTCGFVFENDCIYYGMDSTNNWDAQSIKIVKIDRAKLETDRENCREDVAIVNNAYAVYGLTRTYYPDGFIIWSQYEPGASFVKDKYILQFYDYNTKKLYPIASIDISGISTTKYIGFYAGQRRQDLFSGNIIVRPTPCLQQEKYGYSTVSTHLKVQLTM